MKILIAASGTYGDILPMVALAESLRGRGFDVITASSENHGNSFRSAGFEFHTIGLDYQEELSASTYAQRTGSPLQFLSWFKIFKKDLGLQFTGLIPAAEGADLIIGSSLLFSGRSAAEYYKIPYRHIILIPTVIRSDYHAPFTIPFQNMPRHINRIIWNINRFIFNLFFMKEIDANRKRIGLQPVKQFDLYLEGCFILAADPALAPSPPDFPDDIIRTGYWHAPAEKQLPPELEEFLRNGEKPVYIGFGSMADPDTAKTLKVLKGLTVTGTRMILGGTLAAYAPHFSAAQVFPALDAGHEKLFPRMAAVVHHGGAGTTYTAGKSGVPQIIVPHLMDQFYWGERVRKLNIGPAAIPYRRLSASKLAGAVNGVLRNPLYSKNAQDIAAEIKANSGLEEAVSSIVQLLKIK